MRLPDGWTPTRWREVDDGSTGILAERMQPIDLGPWKRNLIDQHTTFRLGPDGLAAGVLRWDRLSAEADYVASHA
jgi:hypothetical protein